MQTWHELIGNPTLADAIVERILAHSHRIELQGETLRAIQKPLEPGTEVKP